MTGQNIVDGASETSRTVLDIVDEVIIERLLVSLLLRVIVG